MPLIDLKLNIRESTLPADIAQLLEEANQRIEAFVANRNV